MKSLRWLFTAILLALPAGALADYYDGLRAYDAKDYAAAFAEWKAAAGAGDANSQFRLARLYEEGLGVPQNFVQAHLYYNLAGAQGHEEARARARLARRADDQGRARRGAPAGGRMGAGSGPRGGGINGGNRGAGGIYGGRGAGRTRFVGCDERSGRRGPGLSRLARL